MNSKTKTKFICHNCGAETPKWMGKCPNCGEWNSLEEKIEESIPKSIRTLSFQSGKEPTSLTDIEIKDTDRVKLGITELDRPLGGGIVSDSVILWGGEPGIGKSTLILQICDSFTKMGKTVLYCSGEESDIQIKMRAERLSVNTEGCFVFAESNLETILAEVDKLHPDMVIIDSIQTTYLPNSSSAMGSPTQIRDCTAILVKMAKESGIIVMIIGHVTKEGNIAGPRILEHMVDVVFYLEGDRNYQFRVLRTVKNRFGSTSESGLFVMGRKGLKGIDDPSKYLLKGIQEAPVSGSTVAACMEGLRPILIEVQALTVHSVLAVPRRIASGYDFNRLVILLAVLEKKGKIPFSADDVYLNVAGGYKLKETAADFSVALTLFSVKYDIPLKKFCMALGEIGLTGEILPVSKLSLRLKEAVKMNFTEFVLPARNQEEAENYFKDNHREELLSHVVFINHLEEAIHFFKSQV